jgi:probable rRNA maturation factor
LKNAQTERKWIVTVVCADDKMMRTLNYKFLGKNDSTDVIAFELTNDFDQCANGEIYINVEQVPQQAEEYQVLQRDELIRLLAHGIYHLLGFNDKTSRQRASMTRLEDEVIKHFSNFH